MYVYVTALVIGVLLFTLTYSEQCTRNGVSCPDYTVIETYQDYEERLYPALSWVSTSAEAEYRDNVTRELITRLYEYLGGENDRGEQVNMMVPVRTAKIVGNNLNNYTMSIALASDREQAPPLPTDAQVTMRSEPATVYVTRSFGGMIRDEAEWDRKAEILKASVTHDNGVNTNFYLWCVYDSPWRENDRLNEVWMEKNKDAE